MKAAQNGISLREGCSHVWHRIACMDVCLYILFDRLCSQDYWQSVLKHTNMQLVDQGSRDWFHLSDIISMHRDPPFATKYKLLQSFYCSFYNRSISEHCIFSIRSHTWREWYWQHLLSWRTVSYTTQVLATVNWTVITFFIRMLASLLAC